MARSKTTPRVSLRFVEDLIARHLELERQLEELQGEKAQLDEQLRIALDLSPGKRAETEVGTAALVESDVVAYDPEVLRGRIAADLFERLTTRQLDKAHLEAAVSLGLLPPELADEARRLIKRKAQLRVSSR